MSEIVQAHDRLRQYAVTIRRPRVRESEAPFISEILPPYKRRFPELDKTMHELWEEGLSTRDFEPSLRACWVNGTALAVDGLARQQTVSR